MPGDATRVRARVRVEGDPGRPPRLDVDFESGSTVTAIMGPSGAGKTTLLQCIAGGVRPSAGQVSLDGERLFDSDARVFVPPHRRRVAMVFQSLALFPHLAVWENVAYGIRGEAPRARRDTANASSTLSGGEAQRVALARALASAPRLLLLDEPFSALNQALRVELGALLQEILAEASVPTLLVTHDPADARRIATRILQLDAGRIVSDDPV
jgi:molybdate transport system ATP-binding protein